MATIEEIFKPLRDSLKPRGSADLTMLHLKGGAAVNSSLPQKAIDEIIKFATVDSKLGEPESACMQIAKMVLMDSAYFRRMDSERG